MGWIHHMGASINGGSQNGSTWMVYNETSYENGWFRWFRGTPMTLETFTIRAMVKTWDGHHSMLSSGPLVVFECPLSDWWPYHISKMTTASIPVTFLRTLGLVLDLSIHYGSWLVVSNIYFFSIIYGIILPIDFHMFQDGWNHQPDSLWVIDALFLPVCYGLATEIDVCSKWFTRLRVKNVPGNIFPPYFPSCFIFPHTLWLCQNSYWKWPFIVDFPIKNGDFP